MLNFERERNMAQKIEKQEKKIDWIGWEEALKITGMNSRDFTSAVSSFIEKGINAVGSEIRRKPDGSLESFFNKAALLKYKEDLGKEAERIGQELNEIKATKKGKEMKQMAGDVYKGALRHRLAMEADEKTRREEAKNAEMGTD